MRLPFPQHIPLRYAAYFATLLYIAQFLQGTDPAFSLCSFLFILISTLTFNLADGFSRASGAYVFFYASNAVILGIFWKAVQGEPANSNLTHPLLTIQAHLAGITAMFVAVFISRRFTRKRPFLRNMITDANLLNASLGCMILGLLLIVVFMSVGFQSGSALSALSQLNHFLELSIILGVLYQIRRSGGTSSVNLPVLIAMVSTFALGVVGFSKQGMFTPPVCWLIAAASQRYRVSRSQIIGFILATSFALYYLVPYSQYGRNFITKSPSENLATSISLLSNLDYVREQFKLDSETRLENRVQGYFDTPQGFIDRVSMISVDDALITVTEEKGPFGLSPIYLQFEGLIPHVLWPEKPTYRFGNLYAHEIGMVAPDDTVTGISFSPVGEAFRVGRWMGVLLVAPILWIMLFTLYDSLCGDVRKAPWGLLAIVLLAHIAPNGLLGGVIYMLGYGAAGIIFVALVASYGMSVFGALFAGRQHLDLRRAATVRSIPRRLPPIQPSRSAGK